jgi:hypothetical protein
MTLGVAERLVWIARHDRSVPTLQRNPSGLRLAAPV